MAGMQRSRSELSRRTFLTAGVTASAAALGFDLAPTVAHARETARVLRRLRITTTICPYCSVGCGALVTSEMKDGISVAVNVEGDPEHPINEGRLCPKGASLYHLANNENRLRKVLYRAPGAVAFVERDWDWAIREIARRIKSTRDASFASTNAKGQVVDRTTAIASVGSAALDNEECWLLQKLLRSLGLVYIEHQARICHSPTVVGLATSFGRGAMTNHWIDIANSDCVLLMGANPAECHPISMHWVLAAKKQGATVISVDPRFTRSSAVADIYAPLRAGTDIAFLGGLITYILEHDLIHRDYAVNYTNATFLVSDEYDFDPAAGLFSGYLGAEGRYDKHSWGYQLEAEGEPVKDPTLEHPRSVYQLMKKHYARYDLDTVSRVTGTPREVLERVYETYAATGAAERAGTIMYAMGWTQHTVGTQCIRAMAIIQLLLGNIGRAGGGVNALRGESNVQGSSDHGLLFGDYPGYLKAPRASQRTLATYNAAHTPARIGKRSANWWSNYPKYSVSFLKAMFGDAANRQNDFGYGWLPKLDDGTDYSWLTLFDEMHRGNIRGFFAWGQNPACSGANANKVRRALTKLDWLVNVSLFPNETGWFWQDESLRLAPTAIKTEVFILPAAASLEKEGSITNSGRWMQWRYKGPDPPGKAKPDAEIIDLIYGELRRLYAVEGGAFPDPILNLRWDYCEGERCDPQAVAKDVNGLFLEDVEFPDRGERFRKGELVPSFAHLRDDGSTLSGNWLYCGSYTEAGNLSARRTREREGIGLHSEWAWCWPLNRRILYNRASVDRNGRPYDREAPVIEWRQGRWTGDVPDGSWPPMGVAPEAATYPFIMNAEGVGRLFSAHLVDGPLPEHYEPLESPLTANPLNGRMLNPAVKRWTGEADAQAEPGAREFPYVCTTMRVTEHWETGVMTRHIPCLLELQPELFVEISTGLAKDKKIRPGDRVRVVSKRGALTAIALPTARLRPLVVDGRKVEQVALPISFGWLMPPGGRAGESANLLTPNVGDANTLIPESKAFLVDVQKLERPAQPKGLV